MNRIIETLGTSNKKTLRDAFNIKNIREAYVITGEKNPKDAYESLRQLYNEQIEKEQKKKRKEKRIQDNARRAVKRFDDKIETGFGNIASGKTETFSVDYRYKPRGLTPNQYLNKLFTAVKTNLVSSGKKFLMSAGDKIYALNNTTVDRLINKPSVDYLFDVVGGAGGSRQSGGSDKEFTEVDSSVWEGVKSFKVTFSVFNPTNKYDKANGAFFKHNHVTHFDFSRYQIYNVTPADIDNCLVHSLSVGGLSEDKLNTLRLRCRVNNIPMCELENLCQDLKIKINLKKMKSVNDARIFVYGKQFEEVYDVGLLDEHFFINEKTQYTRYCLENYDDVKNEPNCNFIFKKQNAYFKRDESRCIDSFDLVKILLQNKDKLLCELVKTDVCHTSFYKKVDDVIQSLNYEPSEGVNYKKIEQKETKESKRKSLNVFFDFETYTDASKNHVPYLCCIVDDNGSNKSFIGEDCGLQMLKYLYCVHSKTDIVLIAHNSSKYDTYFMLKYLKIESAIVKGSKYMTVKGTFNDMHVQIKDSCLLISMPLKKFPKTFKIANTVKEVISYNMYNLTDCIKRKFIPVSEGIEWINNDKLDENQFLENLKKWNLITEQNTFDCVEYSRKYCEIDCYILKEGYNTFRKWMNELVQIDVNNVLTIASLAHQYFINSGCYEGIFEIGGVPQQFIQKCVVGGRVMCSENNKHKKEGVIMDFDAVSLYPSAMSRMDGFLKGLPKVITPNTNLSIVDGYFVEIEVKSVGNKLKFPLLSYVNEDGIRTFTNDLVGKRIFIDKIALEDAVKYQNIKYEVIRGYYFDEGFNTSINEVIKKVFNARVQLKKQGNPAEIVYKLIMNSGYGKSIMKEIDTEIRFFDNAEKRDIFISRNYNWVYDYEQIEGCNTFRVRTINPINKHFNIAHVGVSILSWSKRIMNEVMCLAEENNIDLFYQDTDSMHLLSDDIDKLASAFNNKYGRELIGENLGQFHSDFELEGCRDIYASRSIFLGKKCYIDELKGTDNEGNEKTGYHIRMKGIPSSCIKYTAKNMGINVFELYEKLYDGEKISFDLTENGDKANFKTNKNGVIETLDLFVREIKF